MQPASVQTADETLGVLEMWANGAETQGAGKQHGTRGP